MNLERFLKEKDSGLDFCRLISPEPTLIFSYEEAVLEVTLLTLQLTQLDPSWE